VLVEKITSRQNPLVKRFRRVRTMGERQHIFLEGVRLIEDAIQAGAHFESVAFTSELESNARGAALLDLLIRTVQCRGALVSKPVMEAIVDTQTPQGIAALVSRPYLELNDLFKENPDLLVIADELQDPGNLGAIIRTAEAAGASGLITTRYTVDPFNDKAIRASMGSALRLPITTGASRLEVASRCRDQGIRIIASRAQSPRTQNVVDSNGQTVTSSAYYEVDMTAPTALILGRESNGVSESWGNNADAFVHIPMSDGIESLNVAAAAAIVLYEAARQRGFEFKPPGTLKPEPVRQP
jgi:TrmH family RNA methyltransferase